MWQHRQFLCLSSSSAPHSDPPVVTSSICVIMVQLCSLKPHCGVLEANSTYWTLGVLTWTSHKLSKGPIDFVTSIIAHISPLPSAGQSTKSLRFLLTILLPSKPPPSQKDSSPRRNLTPGRLQEVTSNTTPS